MACLEHVCLNRACDWIGFDNQTRSSCPKCGGPVQSTYDEEDDDLDVDDLHDDDDDWDDDDDEDDSDDPDDDAA